MPEDLTAVISGAISGLEGSDASAADAGADAGADPVDNTVDDTPADDPGTPESEPDDPGTGDPDPDPGQEEKIPAADPVEEPVKSQLDKDLEELGIRAPKPGERENRLPHSRVRKIAENYGKKVEARFTAEINTLKATNARLGKAGQTLQNIDKLLDSGEAGVDRYMQMLAVVHPGKFDRYLANAKNAPAGKQAPAAPQSVAELGPEPQPDIVYSDKSRGYSPEQYAKHTKWVRDMAKAEAKAEAIAEMEERMEAKYGKLYKSYEEQEAFNAAIPKVKEVVGGVYETWGKELVDKHEDEIVALMENYPSMSTQEAVARVLVPKVRADRNAMRSGLIQETKQRTAAAARVVPGGATANKEGAEPKSLEDVIKRSIAGLKR